MADGSDEGNASLAKLHVNRRIGESGDRITDERR